MPTEQESYIYDWWTAYTNDPALSGEWWQDARVFLDGEDISDTHVCHAISGADGIIERYIIGNDGRLVVVEPSRTHLKCEILRGRVEIRKEKPDA